MAKTKSKDAKQSVSKKDNKKGGKKISALQAGKIVGLHSRYSVHLKKKYVGQLQDVKSWAAQFKEERLIEEIPKFLA